MSSNSSDVVLNQNIVLLTQAIALLNNNMYSTPGGRGNSFTGGGNGGQRPGQGVNSGFDPAKDSIAREKSTKLLTKSLENTTTAMNYFVKNADKNSKDSYRFSMAVSQSFDKYLKQFNATQLTTKIPEQLTKNIGEKFGLVFKDYEDVVRLGSAVNKQNIDTAFNLAEQMQSLGERTEANAKQFDELNRRMEDTGHEFGNIAIAMRGGEQGIKEYTKKYEDLGKATGAYVASQNQLTHSSNVLGGVFKALAGITLFVGEQYITSARAAAKFGTTIDSVGKQLFDAALVGMDYEELAKTQNEQIQAIHSSGMSINEFNNNLRHSAQELIGYTGSLKDGAKIYASSLGTFRSLSSNTNLQSGFIEGQFKQYERLHNVLGVTADQFQDLNASFLNSSNVQAQFYKSSEQQRVATLKGMQLQYEKLRIDGLTNEEAQKVVESLSELSGKKAKDRYKEAAQIQATLGIIGMGGEGKRVAEIIRKGAAATDEERAYVATVQTKAQRTYASKYGANPNNPGAEFVGDALSEIQKFMGAGTAGAGLAYSKGRAQTPEQVATNAAMGYLGQANNSPATQLVNLTMEGQDIYKAGLKQVVEEIGRAAATIAGAVALTKISGLAGEGGLLGKMGVGGKALPFLGKAGGRLAGSIPVLGSLLAAGGTYAATGDAGAATGAGVGTGLGSIIGGAIGSVIAPGLGTAIGATLGGVVGGWLGENIGKKSQADIVSEQTDYRKQSALVDQLQDQKAKYAAEGNQAAADKIQTLIDTTNKHMTELKAHLTKESDIGKSLSGIGLSVKEGNAIAASNGDDAKKQKIISQKDTTRPATRT